MKNTLDNKTRRIDVIGDLIVYTLKKSNKQFYITYNDVIYDILQLEYLYPFCDREGYLEFTPKKRIPFRIHSLVVAIELGYVSSPDDLIEGMKKFRQANIGDKERCSWITIDHADSNIQNNTLLNLSQMTLRENDSKNEIVARFKYPFYMNIAYCNGEYRLQFTIASRNRIEDVLKKYGIPVTLQSEAYSHMYFVCPTARDCIGCLKHLFDLRYEWSDILDSPKEHFREVGRVAYWAGDIVHSTNAQRILSMMDRSQFMLFTASEIHP